MARTILAKLFADGDANTDGLLDLADYQQFQMCFQAPQGGTAECKCLDMDNDNDVDPADTAEFTAALSAGGTE